ncbi:TPA: hypothetical protein HMW52_23795 [Escherichia coli]|nr:hypothetical protein [Escherichia coli]
METTNGYIKSLDIYRDGWQIEYTICCTEKSTEQNYKYQVGITHLNFIREDVPPGTFFSPRGLRV